MRGSKKNKPLLAAHLVAHLVAHRGYAKNYPENTLSAFSAAIKCGGKFLELDIQLTKDHVPCVIHDDNLLRTGNEDVSVLESDWADLEGRVVGESDRLGSKFPTECITSLKDFAIFLHKHQDVHAFVEIKEESVNRFGADIVLGEVLSELLLVSEQCSVISYDHNLLSDLRKISDFPIGFILHAYDDLHKALARALKPDIIICNYTKFPEDDALWQGEWEWMIYEVTDPVVAHKWFNRGVNYIETMDFSEMMTALNK